MAIFGPGFPWQGHFRCLILTELWKIGLTLISKKSPVAESHEAKLEIILAYDVKGNLVLVEILDAPQRVTESHGIEFQMAKS